MGPCELRSTLPILKHKGSEEGCRHVMADIPSLNMHQCHTGRHWGEVGTISGFWSQAAAH